MDYFKNIDWTVADPLDLGQTRELTSALKSQRGCEAIAEAKVKESFQLNVPVAQKRSILGNRAAGNFTRTTVDTISRSPPNVFAKATRELLQPSTSQVPPPMTPTQPVNTSINFEEQVLKLTVKVSNLETVNKQLRMEIQ